MPQAQDLKGIRLGVPEELTGEGGGIEPGVRENFEATLKLAEDLGATHRAVPAPARAARPVGLLPDRPAEASANLARYDGVRYGLRVDGDKDLLTMYTQHPRGRFGPEVKRRIMLGTYALSSGYYDAYYGTAQKVRTKISDDFRAAFERFDFVVTPTSPVDGVRARRQDRRSAGHVPQRLLHGADAARRDPRDLDPVGPERRSPGRIPAGRPGVLRERLLDAAYALEQAIGFDGSSARR